MRPNSAVGERLRFIREREELSLRDLSALLEPDLRLGVNALSRIENGQRSVKVEELLVLAAVLEVSPAELVAPPGARTLSVGERELSAAQVMQWFAGDAGAPDRRSASLEEIRQETRNRQLLADLREEMGFIHEAVDADDPAAVVWGVARTHATLASLTERTMTDDELDRVWREYKLRED